MIPCRLAPAICFAALLSSLACQRVHPEMSAIQKAQAFDAMKHFQAEFNTNNCALIYEEAASPFRSQDPREWTRECALLKEELGFWKTFQVNGAKRWPDRSSTFFLFADAEFDRQNKSIAVAWTLDGAGAHLASVAFREDQRRWKTTPEPAQLIRGPWIDPPRAKSPKSKIAL